MLTDCAISFSLIRTVLEISSFFFHVTVQIVVIILTLGKKTHDAENVAKNVVTKNDIVMNIFKSANRTAKLYVMTNE